MKETEYVNLKMAAHIFKLHYETVRRAAKRGQLAGAVKIGNCWRVDLEKLKEYKNE